LYQKATDIQLNSPRVEKAKKTQVTIDKAITTSAEQSFKRRSLNPLGEYEKTIDPGRAFCTAYSISDYSGGMP
jgi:hypothetical protein